MESVNFGETDQNENVSKAKSSGAKGCTLCPNFFGAFYPSLPRPRKCQENCHDLIFHQPCFFNPQFLHSHVCDNAFQNYCCKHDFNQKSKPSNIDTAMHECCQIRRMLMPHVFCEKTDSSKPESNEGRSKESKEQEWNWMKRDCNCGESLPWTSSPFIIPVVPYCVLLNSQNDTCSNYYCRMENSNRTNVGDFSNAESNENCNKQETGSESVGDCSDDGKRKKKKELDKHNKSSSSIISLNSSQDESKIYNIKEEYSCPSIKAGSDINSEEEGLVLQIKASSSSKSREKVISGNADYSVIFSADNESQRSSLTGSEFDLKAEDSSIEAEEFDGKVKCMEETSEVNNFISPKISLEMFDDLKLEETNAEAIEPCTVKTIVPPKKLIKNFTMTNRTEEACQEKSQISAAGGDLGGNTCSEYEENQFESVCENEETQHFEIKRIPLNGLEERKSGKISGIARLIQDKKVKNTKIIKREENCNDEKRKCYTSETQTREEAFKYLKITPRINRQIKTGSEKQNTETVTGGKKKAKKFPSPRIRPHNCDRNSRK